jgi:hypothetical protein
MRGSVADECRARAAFWKPELASGLATSQRMKKLGLRPDSIIPGND